MSSPSKPGAPVVGFNHNLNHKGRVFHVQTEDSGPQHGHIITHIFMGGNILASTKGTYADVLSRLGPGEVAGTVRKMMEDQHKGMVKSLMGGAYDADIAKRTGSDTFYEPGVLANGERAPGLLVGGEKSSPKSADGPISIPPAPRPAPAPTIPPPAMKPAPVPAPRPPPVPEPTVPPLVLRPTSTPASRAAQPIALASSLPRSTRHSPAAPPPQVMSPAPQGWPAPPPATRAKTPSPRRSPTSLPTPPPARASANAPIPMGARPLDEIVFNYLTADLESQRR